MHACMHTYYMYAHALRHIDEVLGGYALLRLAKEILEIDPRASQKPIWICLTSIGADSGFEAIPVRVTPPACIPPATVLGMSSMFFKVVDEPQELVQYNVHRGIFLSVTQLSDILGARGIPKPRKPHGSGKNGAVRKDDLALCLIKSLFPHALEEDVTRMLAAIMGKKKVKNPETLLQLVSKLDSSETQHFDKMKKDAVQELEILHQRRVQKAKKEMENPDLAAGTPKERPGGPIHPGKGAGVPKSSHSKTQAPKELKDLLPPGVGVCYINLSFSKRTCNVEFRRDWVKTNMFFCSPKAPRVTVFLQCSILFKLFPKYINK